VLSYRLGTVIFIGGFTPVFSYSKPHTYSTFIGKDEDENQQCFFTLYLGQIEHEQKDREVNKKMKF